MDEEEIKIDNLQTLSQYKFELSLPQNIISDERKQKLLQEMKEIIEQNNMYPYFTLLKKDLSLPHPKIDNQTLEKMKEQNEEKLKQLEEVIKDATENSGESEVREAHLNKAQYFHSIGDRENALSSYKMTMSLTVALGQKLDISFNILRIGFAFADTDLVKRYIEIAKTMVDEGGDWERRNRLKVYEGVFHMMNRNFKGATQLFLESISTFSSNELMSYNTFIFYCIIVSVLSLERPELKKKVIDSSDVLSVVREIPHAESYLNSLYNCQYHQFLVALAHSSDEIKKDRFLSRHVRYYSREMRIKAYNQFLQSYKSVTLESMSQQFGLSPEFLDKELFRFIAAGRLNAKIDKVCGIVESSRRDEKNTHYQMCMKQGDLLLNRIQKLSRVIDL